MFCENKIFFSKNVVFGGIIKSLQAFFLNLQHFLSFTGLTYSTVSLLSTVLFLLVATHLNGWKLDRRYGVILMVWYLIFITLASLYELNVFGNMNPPVCATDY